MSNESIKNKKALTQKKYGEMLDDICSEYCPKGKHCVLKLFMLSSHTSPRILIQMKCVEKYKYEINKSKTEEISWKEAWISWIENGYSEKFAEIYDDGVSYTKIYKEIMKDE
ncbi:hypothetical protein D4R86_05170 [bacterium]|nr:MAG: hypothetical protein D4R86_05170 [bacterium]